MSLQEFLYLCEDGVWKEKPRQVVEIKFGDLTCCRLLQSIWSKWRMELLVFSKQDHGLLLHHLIGLQLKEKLCY